LFPGGLFHAYLLSPAGRAMPAYPMGKMGNCPGPRAQGAPHLLEGLVKIKEKGEKKEKRKKEKRTEER